MEKIKINNGSFRDSSGFIFEFGNIILRCINLEYRNHYDHLIKSGLFSSLVKSNLLVNHEEVEFKTTVSETQYKIIQPTKIEDISYPYEWSFTQLKEAALLTLDIQLKSLDYNMQLKDATPYNIQFRGIHPIFIDTLSFEKIHNENYLWKPYKQFCEMFLHPLCLSAFVDPQLSKNLMISNINGISSNLILKILPFKKKLNFSILLHIILPHYFSNKKSTNNSKSKDLIISKDQHLRLLKQLKGFIQGIKLNNKKTQWGQYYKQVKDEKNLYLIDKKATISKMVTDKGLSIAWDLGANDGLFSRLIPKETSVLSMDFDWKSVEFNFKYNKEVNAFNILPLCVDLVNPSPGIGWLNNERSDIFSRLRRPDLIMGLALIHHLLHFNISLPKIIELFDLTQKYVIVEYIPFNDPKSQEIFQTVKYTFSYPTLEEFKSCFHKRFKLLEEKILTQTERRLFLYERK